MDHTTGIAAAFVTLGCWTIGTLTFARASKLADPTSVNRVRLFFAAVVLTPLALWYAHVDLIDLFLLPSLGEWLWLSLSGLLGLTLGDHFAFNAYRIIGGSRASLFNTFAPFAALLLGAAMLGEGIGGMGIAGMCVSIAGIIWFIRISARTRDVHTVDKKHIARGVSFAILGAVGQGLGIVCAKRGLLLEHDGFELTPVHATWIRMLAATVFSYAAGVFNTDLGKEFRSIAFSRRVMKPVALGTLFGPVIGVSMSLLAASLIEVSLAQTIFSLLPVSVMTVSVLSGRERLEAKAFMAALISLAGVFVLVWRHEIAALLGTG